MKLVWSCSTVRIVEFSFIFVIFRLALVTHSSCSSVCSVLQVLLAQKSLVAVQAIIAGGGLDVEMFNRGMQPLAYNIKTKNMAGLLNRYLDGIYLLFTYVTKPESQMALQKRLNLDDDIIRSTTFRLKA